MYCVRSVSDDLTWVGGDDEGWLCSKECIQYLTELVTTPTCSLTTKPFCLIQLILL